MLKVEGNGPGSIQRHYGTVRTRQRWPGGVIRYTRTFVLKQLSMSVERAVMRLSLETREVGRVTIVRCKGRIVAGGENEALHAHVAHLLRDRRAIVLHLGEVVFIDSSGLGTMVRSLTSTRQARGDSRAAPRRRKGKGRCS